MKMVLNPNPKTKRQVDRPESLKSPAKYAYSGYSYRKIHGTILGEKEEFAPHIGKENEEFVCSLCGCVPNVESGAQESALVTGICGDNYEVKDAGEERFTKLPKVSRERLRGRLIYVMKVKQNLLYKDFKRYYPKASEYLGKNHVNRCVLVSKEFYYFGDKAVGISEDKNLFSLLVIPKFRLVGIPQREATRLWEYLQSQKKYEKYRNGRYRNPITLKTKI